MIYFDNSSTTRKKPKEVLDAFVSFIDEIGVSAGRGGYSLGVQSSRCLYQSRKKVAEYFGLSIPNVVFTKNSTEAINMFLRGFLQQGDHVVITCYEHNAVFRPINKLKSEGRIEYSVISIDDLDKCPEEIVRKYCKTNTRLFVSTLASNVTGRIVFRDDLMKAMKQQGIITFLDSSQGAGKIRIDMRKENVDYLAFTGHKDLMGLPGVGGLCSVDKLSFDPLIQGGTGIHGEEYTNPNVYPDGYEAGTLNIPAIWSLAAAIDYIVSNHDWIRNKENELTSYLLNCLKEIPGIIVYDQDKERVSTIGIGFKNVKTSDIVSILDSRDICVRGGIHCAILAHESLGTVETGVVRISLNYTNTKEEIDELIEVLNEVI